MRKDPRGDKACSVSILSSSARSCFDLRACARAIASTIGFPLVERRAAANIAGGEFESRARCSAATRGLAVSSRDRCPRPSVNKGGRSTLGSRSRVGRSGTQGRPSTVNKVTVSVSPSGPQIVVNGDCECSDTAVSCSGSGIHLARLEQGAGGARPRPARGPVRLCGLRGHERMSLLQRRHIGAVTRQWVIF